MERKIEETVAVALGVAVVSLVDEIVDIIAPALMKLVGEGVGTFIKEKHPEMDLDRYQFLFYEALDKAVEISQMTMLKEIVKMEDENGG